MNDLSRMSLRQLLGRQAAIVEEFRRRGVSGGGNLTAELARFLFCAAYGWHEPPRWEKGFSVVGVEGERYLIRGRRLHHRDSRTRQLSAIRDVREFDTLAAVLFDNDYRVRRAALIPCAVVREWGSFVRESNSYRLTLSRDVWRDARVTDATGRLRAVVTKG